ncbi:uncharacterized protein FFB14_14648 [Fusarium fujikuroi]|nr:uncharacterized protein FFB14_14648 [Fusarium fujikuroi]
MRVLYSLSPLLLGGLVTAATGHFCEVYTVKDGDSCFSITQETNVTYAQIISWNSQVDKQCANLGELVGDNLCITNPDGDYSIPENSHGAVEIATTTAPVPMPTPDRTSGRCAEYHLVTAGEDCGDFTLKYEITLKDFIFLNPHVWENCTNVYKDYYYCVRPVGYISTYPGYLPTTVADDRWVPVTGTPVPIGRGSPFDNLKPGPTIPIANGTRQDCNQYFVIPNITAAPLAADCWGLATGWDITPEEFILWNPSLDESLKKGSGSNSYNYPCTLSESVSYCVALESATPAPPGMDDDDDYDDEEDDDDDDDIPTTTAATTTKLPSPTPIQEGMVGKLQQVPLGQRHDNLGICVCVGVIESSTHPTSTSTKTTAKSPTNGVSTPTSIQSGMVSNGNKFHFIKSTTTCQGIVDYDKITIKQFYKWNPAVKSDCSGLWTTTWACVAS